MGPTTALTCVKGRLFAYFEPGKSNLESISYFFEIHFNIILPSVCRSTLLTFSLRLFHQEPISFLFPLLVFTCMASFFPFKNANVM
jgi:hypothetical protein